MKKKQYLKKSFGFLIYTFLAFTQIANAEIYRPYLNTNPDRIDFFSGYCENENQELKLWTAIYKTAKSIDEKLPAIPPEQTRYMNAELRSNNAQRIEAVLRSSIYRMQEIKSSLENIVNISNQYILVHGRIGLDKKVEFVGRTAINLMDLHSNLKMISPEDFRRSLAQKEYFVPSDLVKNLSENFSFYMLWKNLMNHIICYGEKAK